MKNDNYHWKFVITYLSRDALLKTYKRFVKPNGELGMERNLENGTNEVFLYDNLNPISGFYQLS